MGMITQNDLLERLSYNPDGTFTWTKPSKYRPDLLGCVAGCVDNSTGYLKIHIMGKVYYTHRLVWLYHHGVWPEIIDHVDRDTTNNRIENLRASNKIGNAKNSKRPKDNTSGEIGISWSGVSKKWRVFATHAGKQIHGGLFVDFADAIKARDALHACYGFSERHGKEVIHESND